MRKVLIVSGVPYSYSNRGIDTITSYFLDKNFRVDHLVFGVNRKCKIEEFKKKELKLENFKQLYAKPSILPYRILKKYPILLPLYIKEKMITVSDINFKEYNLIVLETGFPLFLLEKVSKESKLILRMSDPIDFSFGIRKDIFYKLEKRSIEQADLILIAHKKLVNIYENYSKKIEYWRTGFDEKKTKFQENFQLDLENSLCYMGNTQLDYELLEKIIKKNNKIKINIIGNHDYKSKNISLNVLGYLDSEEYLKYLNKSKCFIMPFSPKEVKKMSMLGMTSKFYVAMQLGKPILVKRYGEIQEDISDLNIFTYDSYEEANRKLEYILKNNFYKTNRIEKFLEELKNENRKLELDKILTCNKII